MGIKEFIQDEVLLPRLQKVQALVVYDPDRLYRELCLELAGVRRRVVDASESSIESREAALAALQELGQSPAPLDSLIVYVPARAPQSDEEKQRDPFALYAACGAVFPAGDGDEYKSLCLRARPEFAGEIRRIFAGQPTPGFAVIDALGYGGGWPILQTLLGVESARDLLLALLAPSDAQQAALKGQETWLPEARQLFQSALGLNLLTHSKTWQKIADELWRFVLFSEFVHDLPGQAQALPPARRAIFWSTICATVCATTSAARPLILSAPKPLSASWPCPRTVGRCKTWASATPFPLKSASICFRRSKPWSKTMWIACATFWSSANIPSGSTRVKIRRSGCW